VAAKMSRRKIAMYCADELLAGHDVFGRLAAYLSETRRTREADLIIRDIEAALADRGVVVADVQSSQALSSEARQAITSFFGSAMQAKRVVLRESVDGSLLGGVRIVAAGNELDATLRRRINQLKASKL
tara:strand:+ start:603 stop:989 length:387 start_codon:yes stop_codon:yes gene_type:complete